MTKEQYAEYSPLSPIRAELTKVLAFLKLDCEAYKLYQLCAVMTTHGYKEPHLCDCTRTQDERIEYAWRYDD